jgi:hypothetical protein
VPRWSFTDPQAASVGASEATFSATAPVSEVAKTATYTRAYDKSNGFLTLLSDGELLTGAYALGPEAGEWLQQATLAIRARVPLEVLRDTIQPFPTFSEIYIAALKAAWPDHNSTPAGSLRRRACADPCQRGNIDRNPEGSSLKGEYGVMIVSRRRTDQPCAPAGRAPSRRS